MRKAKILTTGMYVPDCVVTNDLLAQAMDTSDEWITQRTGIKERRMVPDTYKMLQQLARAPDKEAYLRTLYESGLDGNINAEMTTADLALAATQVALKQANMKPQDLDLIIQTSVVPDYVFPGVACVLPDTLCLTSTPTFIFSQACADCIVDLPA